VTRLTRATLALWFLAGSPVVCLGAVTDLSGEDQARYLTDQAKALYHNGKLSQASHRLAAALRAADYLPAHQLAAVVCHAQNAPHVALEHYWAAQRPGPDVLTPAAGLEAVRQAELIIECEALMALLLNQERLDRSLALCVPDPRLAQVARQHSEEMRDLRYFDHRSPRASHRSIAERFKLVFGGVMAYSIAENIARRYSQCNYSLCPEGIQHSHEQLMNSRGHRANILTKDFTHVGVGIAVNDNGDYWATQFFARL